jgi:hypothetical protein
VAFPRPVAGLVIRYAYLWRADRLMGREEGIKDRPCTVILSVRNDEGDEIVTVLPITHSPPADPGIALEIPPATKARLGLDGERSWIVLTEANRFVWPGPDLRPVIAGDSQSVAYGLLPRAFYELLRARFIAVLKAGKARLAERGE